MVEVDVEEDDILGIEHRVAGPFRIRIGDALRLAIAEITKQRRAIGKGVHEEEADVAVLQHVIQRINLPVIVGFAAIDVVLRHFAAAIVVQDREVRDDHIGLHRFQLVEKLHQRRSVEPVIRIEHLHVLSLGDRQGGVDS